MAAVSPINKLLYHHQPENYPRGWKKTEFSKERVQQLLVDTFVTLVADVDYRKTAYKTQMSVLNTGFWYPNEYGLCLIEKNQNTRLKYFRDKNAFFHGLPPKGFIQVDDATRPGGKTECGYTLSRDTVPSEALTNIYRGLSFIDCTSLIEIAYYEVLYQILGKNQFDSYFNSGGSHPLCFNPIIGETPLKNFLDIKFTGEVELADQVYYANVPFYGYRHPNGEGQGFSCMCIEKGSTLLENKVTAMGLKPVGYTDDQMFDVLVTEFNAPLLPEEKLFTPELTVRIRKNYSNTPQDITYFEMAKIMQLTKENLKEVREATPENVGLQPIIKSRIDYEKLLNSLED